MTVEMFNKVYLLWLLVLIVVLDNKECERIVTLDGEMVTMVSWS